jgi:hypothetical protein
MGEDRQLREMRELQVVVVVILSKVLGIGLISVNL